MPPKSKKPALSFASLRDSSDEDEPLQTPAKQAPLVPPPLPVIIAPPQPPPITRGPEEDEDSEWESAKPKKPKASPLVFATGKSNPLKAPWRLYFHHPGNPVWTTESYITAATFTTLEDFFNFYYHFNVPVYSNNAYYIMIKGEWGTSSSGNITYSFPPPMWETYRYGGAWSFRIPFVQVDSSWFLTSLAMIGEFLCDEDVRVRGISISPKKTHATLKIWIELKDKLYNRDKLTQILSKNIVGLPTDPYDVFISEFSDNSEKIHYNIDRKRIETTEQDTRGRAGRRSDFGRKRN